MRLLLRYTIRRVDCPGCGVRVEGNPWAEGGSWFTRDFEEHTYLAQTADKTTVVNTMRVAWRTVGDIARRVVDRFRPESARRRAPALGVDELSYRRHHEYVTVVIDHVAQRVVSGAPGKDAATLGEFFKGSAPSAASSSKPVTIDMSAAYIKAVRRPPGDDDLRPATSSGSPTTRSTRSAAPRCARDKQGTEEAKVLKRTRFIHHPPRTPGT